MDTQVVHRQRVSHRSSPGSISARSAIEPKGSDRVNRNTCACRPAVPTPSRPATNGSGVRPGVKEASCCRSPRRRGSGRRREPRRRPGRYQPPAPRSHRCAVSRTRARRRLSRRLSRLAQGARAGVRRGDRRSRSGHPARRRRRRRVPSRDLIPGGGRGDEAATKPNAAAALVSVIRAAADRETSDRRQADSGSR